MNFIVCYKTLKFILFLFVYFFFFSIFYYLIQLSINNLYTSTNAKVNFLITYLTLISRYFKTVLYAGTNCLSVLKKQNKKKLWRCTKEVLNKKHWFFFCSFLFLSFFSEISIWRQSANNKRLEYRRKKFSDFYKLKTNIVVSFIYRIYNKMKFQV